MPVRQPGESRRSAARAMLAREDDFGVALVLILLTVLVFAAAEGPIGQLVSVALSGGTLLFVLHTAGAHRRTFRVSAVDRRGRGVCSTAVALSLGGDAASATAAACRAPARDRRARSSSCGGSCLSPTITVRLVLGRAGDLPAARPRVRVPLPARGDADRAPFFVQTDDARCDPTTSISATRRSRPSASATSRRRTSVGRMVAVSEALVGQLYLVSAVALLVGNIGRTISRRTRLRATRRRTI